MMSMPGFGLALCREGAARVTAARDHPQTAAYSPPITVGVATGMSR